MRVSVLFMMWMTYVCYWQVTEAMQINKLCLSRGSSNSRGGFANKQFCSWDKSHLVVVYNFLLHYMLCCCIFCGSNLLEIFFSFILFERDQDRVISHVLVHSQMHSIAGSGLDWNQDPRVQSWSSTWVVGTPVLELLPAASQAVYWQESWNGGARART